MSAKLRILIVEDNKITAATLAELLRGWGCRVQAAHDPSAIELAREFKPDVVLLDLNLPQMDGITLSHHLRKQEACQDSMFVAITGYDDALYRFMAQDAAIDHYLVKPIDPDALDRLLQLKHGVAAPEERRSTVSGQNIGGPDRPRNLLSRALLRKRKVR